MTIKEKIKSFFKWTFKSWHFWVIFCVKVLWANLGDPFLAEFVGIVIGEFIFILMLYAVVAIIYSIFKKK